MADHHDIDQVARRLLGVPNPHLSKGDELRFGKHGSLAVVVAGDRAGSWFDHENQVGGGVLELLHHNGIVDPQAWLRDQFGDGDRRGDVIRWAYRGETGELLFWACRGRAKNGDKTYWQEQPGPGRDGILRDPRTGKPTMRGARLAVYRLPEILAARKNRNGHPPRIYIVEGEKCADRLAGWGLIATTNPMGAGKWRDAYSPHFAGCDVVILPDNDAAGRRHAAQVARSVAPYAESVKLVVLSGLEPKGDIYDWIDAGGTQGTLEDIVDATPVYAPKNDDGVTFRQGNGHDPGAPPWEHPLEEDFPRLNFLNPTVPAARQWAVPNWFPMFETIGFGGAGAVGKTTIAQSFATAAALGTGYLSLPFTEMKAVLVLCEDRPSDAWLRQVDINRHFACGWNDLVDRLLILPRRNCEHNYLAIFDRDDELHLTTFFHQLFAQLKTFGAKFIVIDGRSDVFWGDQNDERHARMFVRKVTDRIAWELGGLVLLLYQPSRGGRRDGTGESGSVQWDAAFRGRLVLNPPGENDDPKARCLSRKKSNFSANDEEIQLAWERGVFVRTDIPAPDKSNIDRLMDDDKARRIFLALLDKFAQQQRPASSSPTSSFYAPKVFAKERGAQGIKESALERAMRDLFDEGRITNTLIGPPSRRTTIIVFSQGSEGAGGVCVHSPP